MTTLSPRRALAEEFFSLCCNATLDEFQKHINLLENVNLLLEHNSEGETGLALAFIHKNYEIVKYLLSHGAAKSVFVRGKTINSLICTLPQTISISESSMKIPPKVNNTDPEILAQLDEALCTYIHQLATKKIEEAAEKAAKGVVSGAAEDLPPVPSRPPQRSTNQTSLPPASFMNGDLVMLLPSIVSNVIDPECLGIPGSGQVGLVVNAAHKSTNGESKPGEEPDWMISIGGCSLHGTIQSYPSLELCYADGSMRGELISLIESDPRFKTPKIQIGVKVGLKNPETDCVLKYRKNESFVGIVDREFNYYYYQEETWYVKNIDPRAGSTRGQESTLEMKTLEILTKYVPFEVGDRVILKENAPITDKQWCLSSGQSSWKVGVVLLVPPTEATNSTDQRLIYVAPIDDISPFYMSEQEVHSTSSLYKSSWLIRAPPVGDSIHQSDDKSSQFSRFFKPGDRVQLNHGTWIPNSPATAGKCLGTPRENLYGIVRSAGRVTDGVQRNVEVYVVRSKPRNHPSSSIVESTSRPLSSLVSLYPSYSLVPANFFSVTYDTDEEILLLEECLRDMIDKAGLQFDLKKGIEHLGLGIWSELFSPIYGTLGVECLLQHMNHWQKRRMGLYKAQGGWNTVLEKEISSRVESEYDIRKQLNLSSNYGIVEDQNTNPDGVEELPPTWSCLSCGFADNSTSVTTCISCKAKASAWKCFCCTSVNRLWQVYCSACRSSRERSKLLLKADKELKAKQTSQELPHSARPSAQLFLPSYFHSVYELTVLQASRSPYNETRNVASLPQLSDPAFKNAFTLKIFPKRRLDDTLRFHFRHCDQSNGCFGNEVLIIWVRPSDTIADISHRIQTELGKTITDLSFFRENKPLEGFVMLTELRSVFKVGSRVLVDYDNDVALKLATIDCICRDHLYNLVSDDGMKLSSIEENRLRPVISLTEMKDPIKIVEGTVVYLNSKGGGMVNRGVVKKIYNAKAERNNDSNEISGGENCETSVIPTQEGDIQQTEQSGDVDYSNPLNLRYDIEILGSSVIEENVEPEWILFYRSSLHNDAPLDATVKCEGTGHAMHVLIGGYGSSGYQCNKCQGVSTFHRWFCKICQSDYCFNCQPHHSFRQDTIVEVYRQGLWKLGKISRVEGGGTISTDFFDGSAENGMPLTGYRIPEFLDYSYQIPDVATESVSRVVEVNDDDLVEVEESLELPGKQSISVAHTLPGDLEEKYNDREIETLSEIRKTKKAVISGNKSKLFRAIRAVQTFKVGLSYDNITDIDELIKSKDSMSNFALHHLYYILLTKSADALYRNGASRWCLNILLIPPIAVHEGMATLHSRLQSGELSQEESTSTDSFVREKWTKNQLQLYKCLRKGNLFPTHIMKVIFRTPDSFSPSDNLSDLIESLINMQTDDALFYAEDAISKYEESIKSANALSPRQHRDAMSYSYRHSYVYKALALLDAGYGARAAQNELDNYLRSFPGDVDSQSANMYEFDPLTLYVIYMLWKENGQDKRKSSRVRAALALSSFRCFPTVAAEWLTEDDDLDLKVKEEGLIDDGDDEGDVFLDDEDDPESDDDDTGPIDSSSPEFQWDLAKKNHGVESESMDKLMGLTGMREVKLRAVTVCKEVLLAKKRPAHIKSTVSMNFLFVGNPGTGKTTVANLLSAAMVELGYRKNKTPIITSANEILAEQDPMQYFAGLVNQGDNGTIFIDEAYNFNPAPAGQTANPSNKVLDHLMMVSETKRETMTFILAGYKDEIQKLLTYNPGFPSRFPKDFTFEFPDYTESQLRKILKGMVKERGMRLQPIKECGVSLSKIAAQRLAKGRGKKGFGNAREVRVKLEACIVQQMDRLGALALHGKPITDRDYATLTRSDVLGDRPNLPTSSAFQELDAMIGLTKVKESLRSLMNLQLQNYDCEMRGEKVQHISLHRVFLGNAGTGKTTVARIYGRLLKDFGFLSDGDIIEVKPSDLIGSAVGESSSKTAAILESAKGKVLFIDEAYGLDPSRSTSYGGQVIDTLVERIDGNAGVDMAVILAGYEPQMRALFKNANNQGFTRRFNLDEAFEFEDFSDNDLKKVLLSLLRRENLRAGISTVNLAISLISQRRRLDGFGNAAECSIILDRAKLHLASRKQKAADLREKRQRMLKNSELGTTSQSQKRGLGRLKSTSHDYEQEEDSENQIPSEEDCVCDPYLLIDSDFVKVETSAKNAREAFSDLENMDHVMDLLQDMEDTLNQAKKDGLSAAKILEDCHMIFTGPPGTGKTTVAQRFGTMFRQLELLPTDHVEIVTAANLISRYVGNTGPNVVEAMRKAKGGILFVDEAYGMVPKGGSASFGAEAIQAFIDNVTLPEFLGNIIIIFAGYEDDVEQLFGVNPGFRSRFDKRRLVFPSWTAEMATRATVKAAERDHGYGVSDEGKEVLLELYRQLSELPDWGSAREVYKVILPAMYSKRARRLAKKQRLENVLNEESKEENIPKKVVPQSRRAQAKAKESKSDIPPYEASDIREAFAEPIKHRGGDAWNETLKTGKLAPKPKISNPPVATPSPSGGTGGGQNAPRNDSPSSEQVDDENFVPVIASITTLNDLQREVEHAKNDRVLLVISFTASWVSESFELPDFALKYKKVRFCIVSHSDETRSIFDECGVKEMRIFLLYLNGKMVERILDKFSLMCLRIGYWMKKQTCNVLSGGSENGLTLNADGPLQETHRHNKVEKNVEKVLTKNAGEGNDTKDIWVALEEACKELGYSLETIADFLESGDYPEELLRIIKRKVKSDDTSSIVEMLNSQRGAVLEKIKHAIAEIKRKKTAEEQAKLDKAKKIGKCPMDFEWIKVDGGYRCAGGSHFVTENEVNSL